MIRSGRMVVVGLLMLAMWSCSGEDGDVTDVTEPSVTSVPVGPSDDGELRLGLLRDGNAPAAMETSVFTAVDIAVKEINDAGGVGERPVSLVTAGGPESDLTTTAAVQSLLDDGVDAIIGPLSSSDTLSSLETIIERGVLTCSPTASAQALDGYPDERLFFRTIPSSSLEAAAIATAVESAGAATATLAYLDDAYGRPFAEGVRVELEARGISTIESVPFTGSSAVADAALRIADGSPSFLVVIGDNVTGPAVVQSVEEVMRGNPPVYFVNGAQRAPELGQPFADSLLSRIIGVSPLTVPSAGSGLLEKVRAADPATSGVFAANAYDCVNLIALSAVSSDSTLSRVLETQMVGVSESGSPCTTFDACRAELDAGRNIDYDGATEALDLSEGGDPDRAAFEEFRFTAQGNDQVVDTFTVVAGPAAQF
jgi:branched-chain amino acid transport system substrate-binding protein